MNTLMNLDTVIEQLSSGLGLWATQTKWVQKEDVCDEFRVVEEVEEVKRNVTRPPRTRTEKGPSILQQILENMNAEFSSYPRRFRMDLEKHFTEELKTFITDPRVQSYLGGVCTRGTMSYLTNPHSADPSSFLKVMSFLADMNFEWNDKKVSWNASNSKTILIKL